MKIIYIYMLEDMAEWEISFILQALSIEAQLKGGKKEFEIKTISDTKHPIHTIGGLTISPDCSIKEIDYDSMVALLLPGSSSWNCESNKKILEITCSLINEGILIGAICGATLALADLGLLNNREHTSNSLDYLKLFSHNYTGEKFYRESNSYTYKNLITANSAGSLDWAKEIMQALNIYKPKIINSWYKYYSTGNPMFFDELMSQAD